VTGLPAVGVLLANNIRDVPTDAVAGKRTLAVRVGVRRAQYMYVGSVTGALVAAGLIGIAHPWALIALLATPLAILPARLVLRHTDPPTLVRALVATVRFQLVLAALLGIALWNS
jgi:1,4-dihydroxy-2-naphthoate octaprenyltransferase